MELTLDQALQKGVDAHKAGDVKRADRYYTAILKAHPNHSDANHNMGVLVAGLGKFQEALPLFKRALEANFTVTQYWLSYIDTLIKLDQISEAKVVLDQAKSKGALGDRLSELEKRILGLEKSIAEKAFSKRQQDPLQEQLQSLVGLYKQGNYKEVQSQASKLLKEYPNSINLYNIFGAANQSLGKLDDAIEAYRKCLLLKPDYAETYYNMANALKTQGKLDDAIDAYTKALSLKPDYAEAYNSMANALKTQGKLDDAIEAYRKCLSFKPDYAEACYNMGTAFRDLGKLEKAIECYKNALSFKPDFAEIHRNLSSIIKYNKLNDEHLLKVKDLYKTRDLKEEERCQLSFALAKMYDDIGDVDKSFSFLSKGNALRKKLLDYSIDNDKALFAEFRKLHPILSRNSLELKNSCDGLSPIFILGMPRSGTTLLEQIISSHSEVTGGGELNYISKYGFNFYAKLKQINIKSVLNFRDQYLSELEKISNGKSFVTDKMPQNFLFIPLICAAFPEAKIVHIKRNAAATCWSNYKKYFVSESLGYSYDLEDVVTYYELYKDLMKFWQSKYNIRIYNLVYENLTTDQENQTRKLIEYLNLNWEPVCLSPHVNKRSVKTASQQQVRKKLYQGSSEAWRKYEPFINGAFDRLNSHEKL